MKSYDYELSSTNRLSTAKRTSKPLYPLNPPQEELINQLAKVRLLEDELFAEKVRSGSLQRKNYEYIDAIAQLEYLVGELRAELSDAEEQIRRHSQADREMEGYALNLKQVGQELITLNQVLEKKNKQCRQLQHDNSRLRGENSELKQAVSALQAGKQSQLVKLKEILQSVCQDLEPSFNLQAGRYLQLIEQGINDLKNNISHTKGALERIRKQHSEALIKQKEGYIALEYSLKLAQKRNEDLEKKKSIESACVIDKRVEDIIDEMLRKQEELTTQISQLQAENENLKQQVQSQKLASSRFRQVRQDDYEKQLKMAKQSIRSLIAEKQQLQDKYDQLSSWREMENSRSISEELDLGRKFRQFGEENKRLKMRVSQLESDNKMLEKQLSMRTLN